ncbi:XRE family transcriptional regulator [Anabaena azotica]|uniref:XRE family transcriptional regulator n=1 Tax=Anabaena azotica FACHB-119 TaxID=947527 RepID=A0ABR8D403_9NOST|nr:XRE family transcriptional regulator [Anabaena azotica]MBD2501020.1 XRE family transcriptional regulator [Anabaena azotica FACHB-119]
MRPSDTVNSSPEGKDNLRKAYEALSLTQKGLAEKANVSEDTVKRLLGTKECPNGVERWRVEKIAEVLNIKPTDIVNAKDWYPQLIPPEFEILIKDKTQIFCGRGFVFAAIEEFIKNNKSGYFQIIGDAGMGKSAIAAHYVVKNPGTICFFNIRADGKNSPDVFLKLIRQQLTQRWQLSDVADADLSALLIKANKQLSAGESLVIVVDALDEVDQDGNGNLLYLPMILPEKVYFILTRRPYTPAEQRLNISPSVPYQELDLRKYEQNSNDDVKEYIWQLLNSGEYQDGLQQWIQKQNNLSKNGFVETISAKSENNFMYLRCVLPAIAEGFYNVKPLDELPVGLQGYYNSHWRLMGMTNKPLPRNKIKIIYVMCALSSAVSRELIAKYSKQNNLTVEEVLKDWAQFLQKQEIYQPPRYRFYHESFRDFLQRQDIVQAAGVSLTEISAEVARNMIEGLEL